MPFSDASMAIGAFEAPSIEPLSVHSFGFEHDVNITAAEIAAIYILFIF